MRSVASIIGAALLVLAACALVEFDNEQGAFLLPDFVVPQDLPQIPEKLDCGDRFVAYGYWAEIVDDCQGFNGANNFGNRICARAAGRVSAAGRATSCPDRCPKETSQVYRGWQCKFDPIYRTLDAKCAVEVAITCPPEQ